MAHSQSLEDTEWGAVGRRQEAGGRRRLHPTNEAEAEVEVDASWPGGC